MSHPIPLSARPAASARRFPAAPAEHSALSRLTGQMPSAATASPERAKSRGARAPHQLPSARVPTRRSSAAQLLGCSHIMAAQCDGERGRGRGRTQQDSGSGASIDPSRSNHHQSVLVKHHRCTSCTAACRRAGRPIFPSSSSGSTPCDAPRAGGGGARPRPACGVYSAQTAELC